MASFASPDSSSFILVKFPFSDRRFGAVATKRRSLKKYFQTCENIVTSAQSASLDEAEAKGWKAFDSNRNRYALINNLMDEAFKPFRGFFYEYHRMGLDEMINNVANARARIANGLPILKEANRARPTTYVITTFLDAKNDELVNIFAGGTPDEKKKVYELLTDIDPTRQSIYDGINK